MEALSRRLHAHYGAARLGGERGMNGRRMMSRMRMTKSCRSQCGRGRGRGVRTMDAGMHSSRCARLHLRPVRDGGRAAIGGADSRQVKFCSQET